MLTAAAVTPGFIDVNQTELISQEKNDQLAMDRTMPGIILLFTAGFLAFCMIIDHPRFLGRLFASVFDPNKAKVKQASKVGFHTLLDSQDPSTEKVIGGGDLREGWFLRKETNRHIELVSPRTPASDTRGHFPPWVGENESQEMRLASSPFLRPPPHIAPLISYMPFSASLLCTPFSHLPGPFKSIITVKQIYVIVGYVLLTAFALFWRSKLSPAEKTSGYGSDFKRSGHVAIAQLPVVVALGVRGNVLGLCVGQGYEKLKLLHKVIGRTLFVAASIHVIGYIYMWLAAGKFLSSSSQRYVVCGYLAYAAILLITISSLPYIRRAYYGLFKLCHLVGMMMMLFGLAWHVDEAVPFCITGFIFYLASFTGSLAKTRLANAHLHALLSSNTTVVTIPALKSGWRPGQHVRIRIPALGSLHGFEGHPFTISSAPNGEGMVLMCKDAGDWTKRLFDYSRALEASTTEPESGAGRNVTIVIEGPYGGTGNTMLSSFSSLVLVAGGSGITHALAIAHDLIMRAPTGAVRARMVDLVWMVKTEQEAKPLMPTLQELVSDAKSWEAASIEGQKRQANYASPTAFRIQIFVTRCPASSPLALVPSATALSRFNVETSEGKSGMIGHMSGANKEKVAYLSRNPSAASTMSAMRDKNVQLSGITARPARPNLNIIISKIVDESIAHHRQNLTEASGMYITACGPEGLVYSTMQAVKALEAYKRTAVGGVEFEEERFGF
ncbi:hypothetical protein AYX14_05490 [Cryptococcus neoformans]|nr:hypothetical protein AYX14_05490 [Cryptococcus neoformans var. grubii]